VPSNIAGHLSPARRVPHVNRFLQIQGLHQLRKVIRIGIHVIPLPRLAGPAMPPAVMRDAPVPMRREEKHLVLERIRAQWPAVTENHRLPGPPVIVKDLGSIVGNDRAHGAMIGFGYLIRRNGILIAVGMRK